MEGATALCLTTQPSGATKGAAIGHVSPEAAEGGPIALIREGDLIDIDIEGRRIDLRLGEEELARRKAAWKPLPPKVDSGYLARYARQVSSAARGAVFQQ
jgi:dihydroxy-acid dehydratase